MNLVQLGAAVVSDDCAGHGECLWQLDKSHFFGEWGILSQWGRVSRTLGDVQVDGSAEKSKCASATRREAQKESVIQ